MDAKVHLKRLRESWTNCTRCPLEQGRCKRPIVFGAGSSTADFLFIYDTPTEQDADTSSPMSGDHGDLLVDLMETAGIKNTVSYCTPLLGCRPTILLHATDTDPERIADRAPSKEELEACRPRVDELIYRIDPRLIFTLGDLPWKALVKAKDRGTDTTLDKAVGKIQLTRVQGKICVVDYPVIPLLSMKQILASPGSAKHGPLATTIKYLTQGLRHVDYVKNSDKERPTTAP